MGVGRAVEGLLEDVSKEEGEEEGEGGSSLLRPAQGG